MKSESGAFWRVLALCALFGLFLFGLFGSNGVTSEEGWWIRAGVVTMSLLVLCFWSYGILSAGSEKERMLLINRVDNERRKVDQLEAKVKLLEHPPVRTPSPEKGYVCEDSCSTHPALVLEYIDYDENAIITCPKCGWKDKVMNGSREYYHDLFDVSCPKCDKMLLVVPHPKISEPQ